MLVIQMKAFEQLRLVACHGNLVHTCSAVVLPNARDRTCTARLSAEEPRKLREVLLPDVDCHLLDLLLAETERVMEGDATDDGGESSLSFANQL